MSRSVWDLCQEAIKKHKTKGNTYEMFSVGDRVRVITPCQDFNFFFNGPTGTIVKNEGRYLGILVKWDNPRHFESGYIEETFNFEPQDLVNIEEDTLYQIIKKLSKVYQPDSGMASLVSGGLRKLNKDELEGLWMMIQTSMEENEYEKT